VLNAASVTPIRPNGVGEMTPVRVPAMKAGKSVKVGPDQGNGPDAIALAPSEKTVYVANSGVGTVTAISTATEKIRKVVKVGDTPVSIVTAPTSRFAYVINYISQVVTPISMAANSAGRPIRAGHGPVTAAISPDGKNLYVVDYGFPRDAPGKPGDTVTVIRTASGMPVKQIKVGVYPIAIAIVPVVNK
jgi:YVTN family beta-propeller protein